MTEIQELEINIGADGTVRLQVHGVSGPKCLAVTEEIEKVLGDQVTERILSDQYYEQSEVEDSVEAQVTG